MYFDLDTAIFVGFLTLNLSVGIYYSRGIKTIRDYSLGGRNFSTGALVSTIVATWIGGDYLFITMAEVYTTGLHYAVGCLGMVVCLLLHAYLFIPRMHEFLGSISVASAMGDLYGKEVRLISAIGGSIASAGFIAVQFKVFGYILNNFVGLTGNYPIFLAASVVILYSAVGGIRSVTFTDVIQFFTFGVLIPVLGIVVWNDLNNVSNFNFTTALSNPLFDYKQFLGLSNPKFWSLTLLFLLFSIPDINPTMFQRIAIGRSVSQVKKAFSIAAALLFLILVGMAWIAFLLFNVNPDLEPTNLLQYIIDNYSHTGLKSFIMVGVVAMCMSTADSNINASSVLLTHDFCYPLGIKFKSELVLSKIISLVLGISAICLALLDYDLLPLVFMTQSFYAPIITVPLILAILGFRSTTKAVLIGMTAGFMAVIIWRNYYMDTGVDSILPATFANLLFFMGSHYLLKQKGGWVGTKNDQLLVSAKIERNRKWKRFVESITNFNFLEFCKQNSPKNELTYTGFGIFCTISTICTMYSISNIIDDKSTEYILLFYESMLILSVFFITYPVWPNAIKKDIIVRTAWNISIFYLLILCSTFFLILSKFSHLQFVVSIINIIVAAMLTRWKPFLLMVISGIYLSSQFYKHYADIDFIEANMTSTSLILYTLLLSGAVVVIFLKPTQEYQEKIEQKTDYLEDKLEEKTKELHHAIELKHEFLRNLQHEARTPITGITSMGQILDESYDKISEQQRRAAIKEISKSSTRLSSLVNNLIDLSQLQNENYHLSKKQINLSEMVYQRAELCRKLYVPDNNQDRQEFILNVSDKIIIGCDEHYMRQVIDNIIVNAIQYCPEGKITINLLKSPHGEIEFSVSDEGIGVPSEDLDTIFGAFVVSSRTKSKAGGRGVGLALCKKIVELHGGDITAIPNQKKGITLRVRLPIA